MTIRIVINGNEVTNPFTKAFLVFGAVIVAAITTALVIFVLFPIIKNICIIYIIFSNKYQIDR